MAKLVIGLFEIIDVKDEIGERLIGIFIQQFIYSSPGGRFRQQPGHFIRLGQKLHLLFPPFLRIDILSIDQHVNAVI